MLDSMRKAAGGGVAKILLGLLVISFAVWGASGAFVGGTVGDAVQVGGTRVSPAEFRLAYQNRIAALERQFNQRLTRDQAKALGIEQSVSDQMVSGAVLDETARKMGLGMSDERLAASIGEDPTFRDATGQFSRARLQQVLRSIGMSEEDYVRNQEAVAVRRQLASAMSTGIEMPETFFEAFAEYQSERRVFDYLAVGSQDVPAPAAPTDAQLAEYFEANKAAYVAPEYRKLVIVRLLPQDIAKPDAVPTEDVAREYEATKQRYGTPEQRRIQQLSMPDSAAAKAAADRLAAGESFETIVTEQGKTLADVELGLLSKAQVPDQNVAQAAFALEQGKPSGVIDGIFGPVLLRVTAIQPESVKPLAEVEPEIRKALAERKAAEELFDIHDKVEDERAAGDPLPEAAKKAGLEARTVEQVDASGLAPDGTPVPDLPQQAALLTAAFDTDEGVEADPVQVGSEGFVWYEVAGVTAERQKPLEEVRDAVAAAWTQAETARLVAEVANAIRDRAAKGEELATLAAELLAKAPDGQPRPPKTSAEMLRNDTGQDLPAAAVQAGFSAPQGGVTVADGAAPQQKLVIKVAKVIDSRDVPAGQQLQTRMDSQIGDDLMSNMVRDLQTREEVILNRQAIDAALQF